MTQREQVLGGLVVVAMLGVAGWSYSAMADSRARAEDQAVRTGQAIGLAKKIESLRLAGGGQATGGNVEMTRRITEAAEAAGCTGSVERIEPEGARSIGDTGKIREIPTRVSLGKVTMTQGLQFLRAVEAADPGIRATSVRWIAAVGEVWSGEIVFSRLEVNSAER